MLAKNNNKAVEYFNKYLEVGDDSLIVIEIRDIIRE
jgi:hypothetical protein